MDAELVVTAEPNKNGRQSALHYGVVVGHTMSIREKAKRRRFGGTGGVEHYRCELGGGTVSGCQCRIPDTFYGLIRKWWHTCAGSPVVTRHKAYICIFVYLRDTPMCDFGLS
jgi:hypothetical protein